MDFEIKDDTESTCDTCVGRRDVDYTAEMVEGLTLNPRVTTGTAKIRVVSNDNEDEDGDKVFQLRASVGGTAYKSFDFTISDDETPTTVVTLTVDPGTVTSGTGEQDIEVKATVNGKELGEDLELTLILDHNRESQTRTTAERDIDFDASVAPLTIKAGEISGTSMVKVKGIPKATGRF